MTVPSPRVSELDVDTRLDCDLQAQQLYSWDQVSHTGRPDMERRLQRKCINKSATQLLPKERDCDQLGNPVSDFR